MSWIEQKTIWKDSCKTCGITRMFTFKTNGFICGDCSIGFKNGYRRIEVLKDVWRLVRL